MFSLTLEFRYQIVLTDWILRVSRWKRVGRCLREIGDGRSCGSARRHAKCRICCRSSRCISTCDSPARRDRRRTRTCWKSRACLSTTEEVRIVVVRHVRIVAVQDPGTVEGGVSTGCAGQRSISKAVVRSSLSGVALSESHTGTDTCAVRVCVLAPADAIRQRKSQECL